MADKSVHKIDDQNVQYFEGLEIGAVSVKWVRSNLEGVILSETIRHEGYPREKIQRIIKKHKISHRSKIAITGHAAKSFLNLFFFFL